MSSICFAQGLPLLAFILHCQGFHQRMIPCTEHAMRTEAESSCIRQTISCSEFCVHFLILNPFKEVLMMRPL